MSFGSPFPRLFFPCLLLLSPLSRFGPDVFASFLAPPPHTEIVFATSPLFSHPFPHTYLPPLIAFLQPITPSNHHDIHFLAESSIFDAESSLPPDHARFSCFRDWFCDFFFFPELQHLDDNVCYKRTLQFSSRSSPPLFPFSLPLGILFGLYS